MEALREKALQIRQDVLKMCIDAGTGHVTSAFSCIEILVALYYAILRKNPKMPLWDERDRFILSKGQASVALYPILADCGYFPKHDLKEFCHRKGKFGVHLQHSVPGAEITSCSLGQGFGIATGMALAAKKDRKHHMVYTLLGDAECYEGSVWEAAMFANHHRLNNLVAIIDRNHLGVIDWTENMVELEPLLDKWRSFGWDAVTVHGHSFEQLLQMDLPRQRRSAKPFVMICNTTKGYGVSFLENDWTWHGISPKGKDAERAKKELGVS